MHFKAVWASGLLLFALSENAYGQTSLPWLKPEEPKGPEAAEVRESQLPLARVRIEGSADVWVGQAVPMNVEVIVPTWFTGAPKFPELEVPKAMTLSPEAAVNFVVQSGGKTFSAQGRRYLIFPQAKGKYTVPSAKVEVTFALADGKPSPPKLLASPPAQFEAHMPPGAEGAKYFLTTDSLQIGQSFDRQPNGLKIGDSVTRTVTMTAQNTVGISLPPLRFEAPEGVRLYPGMPKVTETAERGKIEATRVETATYVLEREGTYKLPGIKILWWDPQSKKMNKALLPAIEFKVEKNSGYNPEVFASSEEIEKQRPDEPQRALLNHLRPWVSWGGLAALGIIVFLILMGRILPGKGISLQSWLAERRRWRAEAEITYFKRFRKASLANDPRASLRQLMFWLDRTNPRPVVSTLEQFARESDMTELFKGEEALNALLFAQPANAEPLEPQKNWSGRSFYRVVTRARRAQIHKTNKPLRREEHSLFLNPPKNR
jgi:hypothetical protein